MAILPVAAKKSGDRANQIVAGRNQRSMARAARCGGRPRRVAAITAPSRRTGIA